METYKINIADKLIKGDISNSKLLLKIDDGVQWSWNHWDEDVIATYYDGDEKPETPTDEFIKEWVQNTDFEADGYDVKYLKEVFNKQ